MVTQEQTEKRKRIIADIAKTCHEINRQFCLGLRDHSQTDWYNAPAWQRESAIDGVLYHIENPNSTPQDSHINWMVVKIEDGWQYGETKCSIAKTHPCLVPFEQLSLAQQTKDILFHSTVKAMAEHYKEDL